MSKEKSKNVIMSVDDNQEIYMSESAINVVAFLNMDIDENGELKINHVGFAGLGDGIDRETLKRHALKFQEKLVLPNDAFHVAEKTISIKNMKNL